MSTRTLSRSSSSRAAFASTARLGGALALALSATACTGEPLGDDEAGDLAADVAAQSVVVPTYPRTLYLESTAADSANISFGDLDRDGNPDVVLAKGRHTGLIDRVLLGDGHGGIKRSFNLNSATDRSYSASLVDVDRDGDLDIVVSNQLDPKVVYLNDGAGNFRIGSSFGQGWDSRNSSVADMNNDGLPDIIVANRTTTGSYVCLNRGQGRFDSNCVKFAPYPATTITPIDLDRDGKMDAIVPHRDGGQSYVYFGDGTGGFSRRVAFGPAKAAIRMAATGDFNRDGTPDVLISDEASASGGVSLYLGHRDGSLTYSRTIGASAGTPHALVVADLNRDGVVDFAAGYEGARPVAFINGGTGTQFTASPFGDTAGTAYGMAVADFDHDGAKDIGIARSGARNVIYFGSL